MTKVIQNHIL